MLNCLADDDVDLQGRIPQASESAFARVRPIPARVRPGVESGGSAGGGLLWMHQLVSF
jgi:hypothetical protein